MGDWTITISGFSKTFSITGWRIGYSVSAPRWAEMIGYMNDLVDVSRLPGSTGKERALYLLNKTGVAGVPGEAFFHGPEGNDLIRFCFAKTDEELEEGCRRLEGL